MNYLKNMGVTAVWLTPLFEQVEALFVEQAAIHGYWIQDFKRINPRFIGANQEPSLNKTQETRNTTFDRLVEELHKRNMKLILDIVCNHSNPDFSGKKGELYDDGVKIADFNDDQNNWYHHYGEVTNWEDDWQVQNCELCGLATFNENNTDYRNYSRFADFEKELGINGVGCHGCKVAKRQSEKRMAGLVTDKGWGECPSR